MADPSMKSKILLVDDTPSAIDMVRTALEKEGHEVFVATSGEKAIKRAGLAKPDLILLDIMMPGMDGYETCNQLKAQEKTRDIPVIFMSALTDTFDKVKGFHAGAVDYVSKPIETEELFARINTHLIIAGLRRDLQKANARLERRVKKRTRELRESRLQLKWEQLHRIILTSISDTVIITDDEGSFTYVGPNVNVIFGYSEDEVLAMGNISRLLGGTLLDPRYLDLVKEISNIEQRVKDKTGEERVLLVNVKRVSINGGTILFSCRDITPRKRAEEALQRALDELEKRVMERTRELLGVNEQLRREIEERKRAERALAKSEEKYRTLFEESKDAILIVRQDGEIVDANPSCYELFGCPEEEVIGADVERFYGDPSERAVLRVELEAKGFVKDFEWKVRRNDGSSRYCLLSSSVWSDVSGNILGYRGIARDITERKVLEEQLFQAAKLEAIGRLAGGISHDFNNLLTAMMGFADMLKKRIPEDSPEHEKVLEISRAAELAAGLTQQLLAFSRRQILEMEVLDLNTAVSGFEKMLTRLIGERIEVQTILDPSIRRVRADRSRIEQILMNLAVNARDAMPSGGKLIMQTSNVIMDEDHAKIHADVIPGPYVMVAVTDTGSGMDEETLTHIFEPFFTTKGKGRGTGLGLSTVFGLVKQHRGHISVHSEPDRGTTFKVYLPVVEETDETESGTRPARRQPRGTETVLVVEDDELVRKLACLMLEELGYHVLSAKDPERAIALSNDFKGTVDLLLTDVVMPRMDGRHLFNLLSESRPEMRVLYASGYTDDAIVKDCLLTPGIHFLKKPFLMGTLANKVRDALDEGD